MILNDVGAVWDYEINDVSRAFPCNGRFNDRQKLLYECIYNTSEYMFSTLKPGVPLLDVDKIISVDGNNRKEVDTYKETLLIILGRREGGST